MASEHDESKPGLTGNSGGPVVNGLQSGEKPMRVPGDGGKTGLIGALIVLGLVAAGGGWLSYTKHVEDGRLMVAANERIVELSQEVTQLGREKSLMQTSLDALKERNDRQKHEFAQQLVAKDVELEQAQSRVNILEQSADIAVATATNLRNKVDELERRNRVLEARFELAMEAAGMKQPQSSATQSDQGVPAFSAGVQPSADNYARQVRECIQTGVNFSAPPRSSPSNPTAKLRLQFSRVGEVTEIEMRESSGNRQFDQAVVRGVQLCTPFPAPPSGRYPSYIDVVYQMYDGSEVVQRSTEPPIPLETQTYGTCDDIGGCLVNILTASYPADRHVMERDVTRLGGLVQIQRGDRKTAREYNRRGLEAFDRGDYRLAAELFRRGAEFDPGDVELVANLGYALLRADDVDAASGALGAALVLNPRRTASWIPLAEYFARIDVYELAVRSLLVAYNYSRNQETTFKFYSEKAQIEPNAELRRVYQAALEVIDADVYGYSRPPIR